MKGLTEKLALGVVTISLVLVPSMTQAKLNTSSDKYVRSANNYMRAGTDITPALYPQLAKYDLLVLPAEAQNFNRSMFAELRRLNPDITILAYVPSKSFNHQYWTDALHQNLRARIQDSWWLTDSTGRRISIWPGTEMLNMVSPFSKELPKYVHEAIWSTGLWDGIMYDEFSVSASWINGGDVDIHRDGLRDDPNLLNTAWERATINMLRDTRTLLGPSAVIITNGDSAESVQPFLNGRLFESFPTPWEGQGRWQDSMSSYLRLHDLVGYQPTFIINGNSGNTGNQSDYRKMRFTLASALLGNGFFGYDFGEQDHGQLWWYDEQNANLGAPLGPAVNQSFPEGAGVSPGVWRRDYRNGVVLLNSTTRTQTVRFEAELEHLRGGQDSSVNNGRITNSVTLQPSDGVILLKPVQQIVGSAFPNGAYARIYNQGGAIVRNGFFSYVAPFSGSDRIIIRDLDGDDTSETVVAGSTYISIFNASGSLRTSFAPYGPEFRSGINIAIGDLEGDGQLEIVAAPRGDGAPHLVIYDTAGNQLGNRFYAYDYRFRGGVHLAMGDIYGTGRDMIIVGAGQGGGPHVRVFDKWGGVWAQFFSYAWGFRGGTEVVAGDLNGDGTDEIITGAGPGGGPHVRVFNGWGRAIGGFFAGDPNSRNGIQVAVTDVNGDGIDEIAALTTDVFQISTQ